MFRALFLHYYTVLSIQCLHTLYVYDKVCVHKLYMYCTLCLSFCSFGYDFFAFGTSSRWMISQPSLPCPINNIINNFSRTFWPPTIPCISSPDVPVSNCGVRSPNCVYTQQLGGSDPAIAGSDPSRKGDSARGVRPRNWLDPPFVYTCGFADFDPPCRLRSPSNPPFRL